MERQIVELRGNDELWPVDVSCIPVHTVEIPDAPPIIGRNEKAAFGLAPIDEVRLGEALAFLKGIGFVVQSANVKRNCAHYAMVTLVFGQATDPRTRI